MNAKQFLELPIDQLVVLPQLRLVDRTSPRMAELAESIREIGLQQPLTVRLVDGKYVLIDGEWRYWAMVSLGKPTLPVIVEEGDLSESDVIRRQLIPNCQRQEMTPVEKARAIDRLMRCSGWSATQAAAKLAMSSASVTRLLSLLSLPAAVLAKVESGELVASAAYEISKEGDLAKQLALAGEAASGQLTRDALSGRLKAARHNESGAVTAKPSRVTVRLDATRSITVAAQGLTIESMVECLEELLSKARQARNKGLALTTFTKVMADQTRQ